MALQQAETLMQALCAGRGDGFEQQQIRVCGREGSTVDILNGARQ